MKERCYNNLIRCEGDKGFVLLIVMVLLVILSALGYTLTTQVSSRLHRDQYLIDYQAARYACDSGVKYAMASLEDIKPMLVSRPNEPDFSDLFKLDEVEYQELLSNWAAQQEAELAKQDIAKSVSGNKFQTVLKTLFSNTNKDYLSGGKSGKNFDPNKDYMSADKSGKEYDPNMDYIAEDTSGQGIDPNTLTISGPYGSEWPLVQPPKEFEIGTAKIIIEIEDENAKYPIIWALLDDPEDGELKRSADASFKTFCEWMDLSSTDIDQIISELEEINQIKPFKLNPEPIKIIERKPSSERTITAARTRTRQPVGRMVTTVKTIPASVHTTDYAKLLHSSMLDTEILARPVVKSEKRNESALKYLGIWGSDKVNINSAPRQVLEAAFIFGGDEVKIAEQIIRQRQIKPFKDMEEFKKEFQNYTMSIQKCEKYITTESTFFTIKVKATSGSAKVSTMIGIIKKDTKIERVAVLSG